MSHQSQNLAENIIGFGVEKRPAEDFIQTDLAKLSELAAIKDATAKRFQIGNHIDELIRDFQDGARDPKSFEILFKRLNILWVGSSITELDSYDLDRSWRQEQVDTLLEIYENRAEGDNDFYEKTAGSMRERYFDNIFVTKEKEGKEKDTISELMANGLIGLVKKGNIFSNALQAEIRAWFNNIYIIDAEVRVNLISSFLNNPGQVDRNTASELVAYQGIYGGFLPSQLEKQYLLNKNDINKTLKIIDVLDRLKDRSDQAGFEGAALKSKDILDNISTDTDNYFVKSKLALLSPRRKENRGLDLSQLLRKYNDPDLRTGAAPLERRGWYDQPAFAAKCSYSKLSDKYGVIYNPFDGGVDSFFEIGSLKKENLRLENIIAREGMSFFADMKLDEQENLINNFKSLMAVDFRSRIEEEFGIEMSSFDIREQLQFVNFLSTKTTQEVEKVKQFLNQGQADESKKHRIKCFLSLEFGEEMGERILSIGQNLENQPQVADRLFAEYSRMIDEVEKNAEEVCRLYAEIFFKKDLGRNQVIEAILRKGKDLLFEASEDLEKVKPSERENAIVELISNLKHQQITQRKEIDELKKIGLELNKEYSNFVKNFSDPELQKEFENWQENVPEMKGERLREFLLSEQTKHRKFDSQRLQDMIENYKAIYEMSNEQFQAMQEIAGEEVAKRSREISEKEGAKYKPLIKELEKLLQYQINFEHKLKRIILGQESATLPRELLADLAKEASESGTENIPSQEPLYFPVGISKDLPAWERVFNGEMKAAKPIDAYGYLFWLNNQGRKAELVVCDEIQKSNYQVLYGKTEREALEVSRKIGAEEKNFYKKLIKTFGLNNISVVEYRDFKEGVNYRFQKYQTLCRKLSQNQSMQNAFLSMVPESVGSLQDRERQLPYAIEELSWILANDGTKVSHLNEARYDAIAAVLKNTEGFLRTRRIDIFSFPDGQGLLPFILESAQTLRNLANEKKSQVEKDSAEFSYWKNIFDCLGQIKRPAGADIKPVREMRKRKNDFNFICPSVGAQSFGLEDVGGIRKKNVLKFKEPYSTYFVSPEGAELFLDSDQVVAVPKGHIGGKVLTLSEINQTKYAEKVIKPLLVQFFEAIRHAPREYFEKVKKTRDELIAECRESATLSDLLKFVQRYVVAPSMEKAAT